jgi:hypothetical protein
MYRLRGAVFLLMILGPGAGVASAQIYRVAEILDGLDPRQFRVPSDIHRSEHPENVAIDNDALARERELGRRQEKWLKSKGLD